MWKLKENLNSLYIYHISPSGVCCEYLNTLRPRQYDQHFADVIFKWISLNENHCILIKISLKFVRKFPINNPTHCVCNSILHILIVLGNKATYWAKWFKLSSIFYTHTQADKKMNNFVSQANKKVISRPGMIELCSVAVDYIHSWKGSDSY